VRAPGENIADIAALDYRHLRAGVSRGVGAIAGPPC
jgi:hypothetical protein